jgi:organic hydroperoxide reductase OsmC/OhrA
MAHVYTANVVWSRGDQVYTDRKYSRGHAWRFDGGVEVPGSSSPLVVKPPLSREDAVDPEEAFVAALASCHMLFFLDFAARAGFRVDRYDDAAEGEMGKGADGKVFVAKVTLKPAITWSGAKTPTAAEIADLHHKSHDHCFIANSVKSEVVIADVPPRFV